MNYLYSNQYYPLGIAPRLRGQDMAQPGMPYVSSQYEPVQGMPYASQQYGTAPGMAYAAMPGFPDVFAEEKQVFEDARRLQSFYPRIAQEIQQHVEEECDRMEYEGSMMFDEYPDRVTILRLVERIKDQMKDFSVEEALKNPEFGGERSQEIIETSLPEKKASENPLTEQADRRRPGRNNDWLGDMIQGVLLDEMHRRRCRHRRCRNRRFW